MAETWTNQYTPTPTIHYVSSFIHSFANNAAYIFSIKAGTHREFNERYVLSFEYSRSLRYGHSIRSHAHNTKNAAPSELPLPQTSTLRSRRRLARLLVAGSFVFVFCWSPHVIFLICTKWSAAETYSKTMASYSLFFGKWLLFIRSASSVHLWNLFVLKWFLLMIISSWYAKVDMLFCCEFWPIFFY